MNRPWTKLLQSVQQVGRTQGIYKKLPKLDNSENCKFPRNCNMLGPFFWNTLYNYEEKNTEAFIPINNFVSTVISYFLF